MDVPQQSASFLRMPYWKVISSLFWISLVAFLSWFCAGFNAWSLEDAGNATLSNDSYYIYRVSFLITFIFSFCLLWMRFKAKFLIPVFIVMGVGAFAMFSTLQKAELQRKLVILERYQSFRGALNSENWEAAYLLMSPEYHEEHTVEEFEEDILYLIDLTYLSEPDWVQEINIHAIHRVQKQCLFQNRGFLRIFIQVVELAGIW